VPVPAQSSYRFRFGAFEADLETGELLKNGRRVWLQQKPFQVLATLLEQRGKLVSRETLRRRLWPTDTFVDFDNGLNAAVSKLREALGDSADKHRYFETLPRRGYRFVAAVEELGVQVAAPRGELELNKKRIEPDIVVVEVTGRIIYGPECRQIEWLIADLMLENERKIIFDISGVSYVDSTGVGIIVMCFGKIMKLGGQLRIAGAKGTVLEVLKMVKADRIVPFHPTPAEAARGFTVAT